MESFTVAKGIWDLLVGLINGYKARKRDLFKEHVEPLHTRVLQIHRDYQRGFAEARQCLADRKRPPGEVLLFLKERRRECEAERDLTEKLSEELRLAQRSRISDPVMAHISAYCESIARYLRRASGMGGFSWYSDFIRSVEARIRTDLSDVWGSGGISGDPRTDLLGEIDLILDRGLAKALGPVNAHYAVLRTELV